MEFLHYSLAAFVDNSPRRNPPRFSVINDVNSPVDKPAGSCALEVSSVVLEQDERVFDTYTQREQSACCRGSVPPCPKVRLSQMKHCQKCGDLKPERCHHCSTCKQCCLKFDHHCLFFIDFIHQCVVVCLSCLIMSIQAHSLETALDSIIISSFYASCSGQFPHACFCSWRVFQY